MIQVHDLRVDYDDVCAVQELNLEIGAGEIYGLIGPNGAGKTSTLRSLMGLQEPTYGEIVLNGIDLESRREEAIQMVGFMPDFSPIYEDLMVWEFLDLFAASYGVPRSRRPALIAENLELVDLTEKRDALTAGLSRGMKQRLMLAKTLLSDPQIVLLDEPASGMDPHGRILLKNIMQGLGSQGKTVMISSHILAELSEFCTSIGIMERGKMVLSGRVDEVKDRVLGRAEIAVELVSGEARFREILLSDPRAGDLTGEGGSFSFSFEGGPEETSELLSSLVSAGVRVVSFARKKEGLEEVFLRVGAREVS
jgi:ABC-2 type transport system ATP-binding protein